MCIWPQMVEGVEFHDSWISVFLVIAARLISLFVAHAFDIYRQAHPFSALISFRFHWDSIVFFPHNQFIRHISTATTKKKRKKKYYWLLLLEFKFITCVQYYFVFVWLAGWLVGWLVGWLAAHTHLTDSTEFIVRLKVKERENTQNDNDNNDVDVVHLLFLFVLFFVSVFCLRIVNE